MHHCSGGIKLSDESDTRRRLRGKSINNGAIVGNRRVVVQVRDVVVCRLIVACRCVCPDTDAAGCPRILNLRSPVHAANWLRQRLI